MCITIKQTYQLFKAINHQSNKKIIEKQVTYLLFLRIFLGSYTNFTVSLLGVIVIRRSAFLYIPMALLV